MANLKNTLISLDEDLLQKIAEEAAENKRTKKAQAEYIIEQYYKNKEGKGKESSKKPEDDSGIFRLKKYLREAG